MAFRCSITPFWFHALIEERPHAHKKPPVAHVGAAAHNNNNLLRISQECAAAEYRGTSTH